MVAFLKAIDLKVWKSAVNGYSLPTITINVVTSLKPEDKWTMEEKLAATCNSRALNAIYNGVCMSELRRISTCTTAKEAWDILHTVHEGTDTVKQSKLQKLYTAFESIKMENDENPESDKPDIGKGKFITFMATSSSATSHVSSEAETD